jgi:hypothetical protein
VVRRSKKKKKRGKAAPDAVAQQNDSAREDVAALKEEQRRRKEQQERAIRVSGAVKRLRLARNLRSFVRFGHDSPQILALQLANSSENDQLRFLAKYDRVKGRRSTGTLKQEGHTRVLKRCMRLEREAAM